mgnify:CR=1 FL=1
MRLISVKELAQQLGRSETWLWRRERTDPSFPKRIRLGPNSVAYRTDEIERYLEGCARGPKDSPILGEHARAARKRQRLARGEAAAGAAEATAPKRAA